MPVVPRPETTPKPSSPSRRVDWAMMVINLAVMTAYCGCYFVPLFFDDTASIIQNQSIRQLWPLTDVLFAPDVAGTAGRPLLNFSYALNYALGGLAPVWYHTVNLAIHLLAAGALYGLLRGFFVLPWWRGRFDASAARMVAFTTTLLWAVHPLQTESVTYVSQRAESLVGMFYLLTWYAFVRAAEPGAARRWGVLSVGACVAGVLTKEIIVTAPVVILIFDRVFLSGSWREVWARRRGIYLGYAGAWVLLGALMLGSRLFTRGIGYSAGTSLISYALTECEALALYLKLSFWPHPLVIDYGPTPARGGLFLAVGVVVVVAWIGGVVVAWRRHRAVAFAGLAMLAMLAPTSSVVPVVFQPIAEHRMYLPLALLLAVLVSMAWIRWGMRILIGGLAIALVFVATTIRRNWDYRSEEAIWRATIAARPDNWRAYNALANVLYAKDRLPEGIALLEAALKLNPTEGKLYNNYANALTVVGRLPEAIAAGARAIELAPDYAEARSSFAQTLLKDGRAAEAAEAVTQLEVARGLKPESAEIRSNLCDALRRIGRAAEAVKEGEAAVRLLADFPAAHCNLGLALVEVGRTDEAIAHYETALRLKPDYLEVRNNLGVTLMNVGRLAEAQAQLMEAIRLKPAYAEAHNSLGIVFAKLGKLEEAGREFETALRLQPGHAGAQGNLKLLRSMEEQAAKK